MLRVDRPTPPKALKKAQINLKKIQMNWWAQKVVGRMSTAEREAMRLKVAAYAVVGGKRADWGWDREWIGNYLTQPSDSHDPAVYKGQMDALKGKGAFRRVLFSSLCIKLSSKGKPQPRALVITDTEVMKLDPTKFKSGSFGSSGNLPIASITGIQLLDVAVPLVVIETNNNQDMALYLVHGDTAAELAARLVKHCFKVARTVLKVEVASWVTYAMKAGPTKVSAAVCIRVSACQREAGESAFLCFKCTFRIDRTYARTHTLVHAHARACRHQYTTTHL